MGSFEGLMHRRWLMDAPCDGFEVVDVERPGVDIAVPADDIKRVMLVVVGVDAPALVDTHLKVAQLGVSLQRFGHADVALAVGRMLHRLPIFVAVAARRLNLPANRLNPYQFRGQLYQTPAARSCRAGSPDNRPRRSADARTATPAAQSLHARK